MGTVTAVSVGVGRVVRGAAGVVLFALAAGALGRVGGEVEVRWAP